MFKGGVTRESGTFQDHVDNQGLLTYPTLLNLCVRFTRQKIALNIHLISYDLPPLFDVSIEEFETCALDRLRVLVEIESSLARNRSWEELKSVTQGVCAKYMPLSATISSRYTNLDAERRKDHLSHFVLRLAFCRS